MDLRDTPDEAAFRSEVRAWVEANLPQELRSHRGGAAGFEELGREWSRKLSDAGYAGLTWPKEYGGGGAPYTHQAILLEELARAKAPQHVGVIGLGMAGPTIIAHGTQEQKARYLPKILTAKEIWCQGFSELFERSRRLTGGLIESGVEPGDRVVVTMPNCPDLPLVYQVFWSAGAAITPAVFFPPARSAATPCSSAPQSRRRASLAGPIRPTTRSSPSSRSSWATRPRKPC